MAIDLRIAGGDVVTAAGVRRADVLVDGEKIAGIVSPSVEISEVGRTVDATDKLVIPGMVDPHVHTREPGFTRTRRSRFFPSASMPRLATTSSSSAVVASVANVFSTRASPSSFSEENPSSLTTE